MILIFYSTFAPTAQHLATLRSLAGNEPVHVAENEADAIAHAPNARIVLGHRYLRQILPHVTRLEWVQSTAAGVDILQAPALLKQNVIVSRCPANSEAIAQHALALAWALQRRLPEYVQAQTASHWLTPTRMAPLPAPPSFWAWDQLANNWPDCCVDSASTSGAQLVRQTRKKSPVATNTCLRINGTAPYQTPTCYLPACH